MQRRSAWLMIIGLTLIPQQAQAEHFDANQVQHFLQWDQRRTFFDGWLSTKQRSGDQLFKGLLESHSETSTSHRATRLPPPEYLTLDQLNHYWIQHAVEAYKAKDWFDAQHALSQLTQPVNPLQSPVAKLIGQATKIQLGQPATSSLDMQDPVLARLVVYNQALSLVDKGQHSAALPLLEQLRLKLTQDDGILSDLTALLKAYSLTQTGQTEQALLSLQSVASSAQLAEYRLPIEALAHHKSGDTQTAARLLLKLSSFSPQQQITPSNFQLLAQLQELNAEMQAAQLASRWLLPMQRRYIDLRNLVQQVNSDVFQQQLKQRQSGDVATSLMSALSFDSRLLLTEIERSNSLLKQLDGQLSLIKQQTALLNRGYDYIKGELKKHKELLPVPGARLPTAIFEGDPSIRELEISLSELVGQPEPWLLRYTLLDGLAIWHTGNRFINRWWEQDSAATAAKIDFAAATRELASYYAEQLSKASLLEEMRVEQELLNLPALEQRAKAIQSQLQQQRQLLITALANALQIEPAQMVLQTEQSLLWLSALIAPQARHFNQPEMQQWYAFEPSASAAASSQSSANTAPPYELALSALQALADNALNPEIKFQAIRHLADLKLLMSERILGGDAISPRADLTPASAIALYQQLIDNQHPVINRQQVLYQLAKAYDLEGLPQQQLETLQRLIEEGAPSQMLAEIKFRIAETQFSLKQYDLAEESYLSVLGADNTGQYSDQVHYKLAWSIFKQGEYSDALEQFFVIVERHWAANNATQSIASQQSLLDDTLRVIALTFAYMDGTRSLQQHFDSVGSKPYEEQVYLNLGAYFEYKRRFNDAAETFSAMTVRFPSADNAPYYQSRVVSAYTAGGFPSKSWPAREDFIERFGIDSQVWQQATSAQRDRIREYLAGYLIDLTQREHALAQQAKQPSGTDPQQQALKLQHYSQALALYDHFIAALPNAPQLAEMLFMKAEMLTDTGQLEQAAIIYQQVAYQHSGYSRSDEAGYASLLAYQQLYQAADKNSPIAERWLQKAIEQGQLFSSHFPNSKYTAETQTKVAEDLFIYGDYRPAIDLATDLIQRIPDLDEPILLRLWRVIAHASFNSQRYAEAEQAYQKLLPLSADTEEQTTQKRLSESIYKQGEQAQQAGELITALAHYQRLGQQAPDAHILPQAEFDSATLLLQLERWPEAVVTLEQFRRDHPTSTLQATIDEKLVVAYEATKNWPKAALALQRIFEREGKSELGRDALWRAASLDETAGNLPAATNGYQRYIETFPSPHEPAMEARLKLYQLAQKQADNRIQRRWLQAIVTVEVKARGASTDRSLMIASDAALILGKQAKADFDQQSLTLPLEDSLPRKREAMESSIRYLSQVTDFGLSTQSTKATALLGQLYREFSQALMTSQRPKKLSELELEQYDILLEEQALPFEDKAIELHQINVGQIRHGIYTPAIESSLNELRQMMPARYAKDERLPEYSDAIQ